MCGKGYIKYNRMINCINNHQGIYKYRCPECEYKTNKLLQFKEHVNSHTGEKAFFCPVCHHQSNGTKNLGCHTKQVHKLTLCQAEIMYKTSRLGTPMTEDQIGTISFFIFLFAS
ncbi:RE1-silencing transcription factor B [Eurytemora carolleeae]|uniref:RE1-silencing transcription factor B n=1 Tax=Eurytemora carolleeae TaxID=1294199 RepID=UPI000C76DDE7|nr:RE1-silencing transcription factor B [Eurytemora carolleeae]|eukprot:XP_023338086.1 RE1-silencing transcription factor B-like [Eurytemora affinis]